jgi:Fe-S-cluster containining protein
VPYIFMSEHSCEATVPEPYRSYIHVPAGGNPQRISLRGHDEYTVKFSHLESVARTFSYRTIRGPLADVIPFDFNDRLRFILASRSVEKDEYEMIRHFVGDLYQYEFLLLIREAPAEGTTARECGRCGKCCLADFIAYVHEEDLERWRREGREDILGIIEREQAVWAGDHFASAVDGRYLHGCPFLTWEGNCHACAIYETRPGTCRRYVPGSSEICSQFQRSQQDHAPENPGSEKTSFIRMDSPPD